MSDIQKPKRNKSLIIGDIKYYTQYTKKFINRKKWKNPNPYHIVSFIPGTVLDVNVKEGDSVEEGEQLMLLKAMKMKNVIEMPYNGKILKVNVRKGQKIPKDFLMFELSD